ncbi:hypothetical protein Cf24236_1673 [Citrobacter farmeri]|nr:hypothetical protein Cf24236_1673 [Citrobacter farmeri]HAU5704411.1 hypothetical protein [Citrobacter freundii]
MFKSILSLLFNEVLLIVSIIAFGFFYLNFFPTYWFPLTIASTIVLIIILPKFTERFDKYNK